MTALELADWIENGAPFGKYETAKQAVVMLRQQQAEIEALKVSNQNVKTLTDEEIIDIIERLIADWKDDFKNYKYNSDEPEENKLRDDVFAILRKAQENELLKKLAVPDEARQKLHELQVKQCGDSYDTVCPPSVCDCRKAQEK